MITGANTNVRHRGIIFHVQTEDSGRSNPHVISHLYHHRTILASNKTEYGEHPDLDPEALEGVVKGLIESQHGEMLEGLKSGAYDAVIQERLNPEGASTDPRFEEAVTDGLETPTPMPEIEESPRPEPAQPEANARAFGEGIVSQKPLDEVILEYLAEKARDRAADRADKSVQKSRSSG